MRRLFAELTRSPLGLAGAIAATVAGILVVTLLALGLVGFHGGPYLGILAFVILPGVFVVGLLLIPLGDWLARRRRAGGGEEPALPVVDLNHPATRRRVLFIAALTVVNVVIVALATFGAVEVMDSPAFCGSCHSVMDPEFTAYQRSNHARVACVECHIGPGAPWFVKSKLSGAWQLVSVTFDLYERPIPVPVHDLRPARDTCERCHWPTRFVGDRLRVRTSHADDAASTPRRTVLVVHVGGGQQGGGGVHWHVRPGVQVRYQADPSRSKIGAVELALADGTRRTFRGSEPVEGGGGEWRTMDCVDCHNRPTHVFGTPEREVDAAIVAGRIDRALPFVRREGVRLVREEHPSHEVARAAIRDGLRAFYAREHPDVARSRSDAIDAAAAALGDVYATNVWPSMRIGWGTYPSFVGHEEAPGCFRCHDEAHATEDGRTLSQDCDLCHRVLADGEVDPPVLKELGR
jgi:NapC/NirT cytochrome c family protein